jgi:pimeloyl-ACP methyl ester carboxylesterase
MDTKRRELDVRGRKVALIEAGAGTPLVYLHGFADVHGVVADLLPFHQELAKRCQLFVPAHPGCNGSDDFDQGNKIED